MDCGYNPEPELDPMFEEDTAIGTSDEVSGFLNQLVDQSITDLMEEDDELPLQDLKEKKMTQKKECATSKSLPCLDLKKMDGIPSKSTSTSMQKASSLPSLRQIKRSQGRIDNWDMRKHTLIKQYQKAMLDSCFSRVSSVIQEETGSRPVTASDLAAPQSTSKIPEVGSDSGVMAQNNDIDDNIEEEIGDFVSESLLSITNEANQENEMPETGLDDQIDDFITTSLMSVVSNVGSLQAEREMEKELHKEEEGQSLKLTETSIVSKAEREMEKELHKDEEGQSLKLTETSIVSKAEREMEKELHKDEEGQSLKLTETSIVSKAEREMEKELNKNEEGQSPKLTETSIVSKAEREMEKELHKDEEGQSLKLTETSIVSKAEREMEKELHKDEEGQSPKRTETSVVSKTEREMEKELHKDEEGQSPKRTETSVVSKTEREMEKELHKDEEDTIKPSVDIGSERKPSSSSIFGLIFKRRKSKGSLKLKFPCIGLMCCTVPQDVDEDAGDSGCTSNISHAKKPGILKRMFTCLRKRGARVAPL